MTVRWKPLLILSGLFVVVALAGLMTIAMVMGKPGAADILVRARAEKKAGQFEKSETDYKRALQIDGRNASVHEEVADLYEDWASQAPAEKKAELRRLAIGSLINSARTGTKRAGPRRRLLAESLRQDDTMEQAHWAKDLVTLEPNNAEAHYVLAALQLEQASPNLSEVRQHLKLVDAETPRRVRADWLAARVAYLAHDQTKLEQILAQARTMTLPADTDPVDRLSMLKLRVLDVELSPDALAMSGRVEAVAREALGGVAEADIPSQRIARIGRFIEGLQRYLAKKSMEQPVARDKFEACNVILDHAADAIFEKAIAIKTGVDLDVYLAYADHLRFRDQRGRCLDVVQQAFKSPAGTKQATTDTAMGLHALAAEASLANSADQARYDVAASHIRALLDAKADKFQGLGHLFQGAIDLEKAGMIIDAQVGEIPRGEQAKLRASALGHLRIAASLLPKVAEAQARYGVALILNQEPAMGRQYLQLAQRLGNLQPQYLIWTAWSVVQAGYPEDAEPIVSGMLAAIEAGQLPRTLEGTLHLLNGEIYQSRKTTADLKKAIDEYRLAFANGQDATPAVELRLAQIEVMLGRSGDALKRIDWLASKDKAGPAAENLAVLTLQELKRDDDAARRLAAARLKYPESSELAVLDSAVQLKAKRPEQADRVLVEFLAKVPDNVPAVQQRAKILADVLNRPDDARQLLKSVADRADNSAPLVQLVLLELELKNYDAVPLAIAKIRQRWKDAATGDLLDAQLALAKKDITAASAHFEAALKKDPSNKVAQFYKAQLDGRSDPERSSKVFESLAGEDSIKEIEPGLSLVTASRSALASIDIESGDLDSALTRYRDMLKGMENGAISRSIRWQIVAALGAKKDWPAARTEIESLLNDPKFPATPKDRVRAATFYRLGSEDAKALAQVEMVLKADPTDPEAVVTRAEILARGKRQPEAIATLRKAIEATSAAGKEPQSGFYLMMAAVEASVPPAEQGYKRALPILEEGLSVVPDSTELVLAKTRVLTITNGPKAGSAFVEEMARAKPKGPYRRMLLTTYRDQGDFASAERVAAEMAKDDPTDTIATANQVRMIAAQSVEAASKGNRDEARRLDDKAATLIYDARAKWKADPNFTQLDCELEMRRGDFTRALALSHDVDALAKSSPIGPLLRAQIFSAKGQAREAAAAYAEAIGRNPRLADARLQLARLSLRAGQTDEAIRQARYLQDSADPDKMTGLAALLVEARAIAVQPGTPAQVQANHAKAIEKLAGALREKPDFADASYQMADIYLMSGDRARAVATLKAALKTRPDDATALSLLVQFQAERRTKTQPATPAEVDEAVATAHSFADSDTKGELYLAVSGGFVKAGLPEQALPWAEKAAEKMNGIEARLALGDLLLTLSEAKPDSAEGRKLLDRSLAEYDKVLTVQPNLIEAVNNKAWILHSYLNQSQAALELAQGLLSRVDASVLPGEFFDTLGSIQEKLGRGRDAEESYKKGLGKSPDHPVLNYHMGRLMADDKARVRKAIDYLKMAEAGRDRMPAAMADKLNSLLRQVAE